MIYIKKRNLSQVLAIYIFTVPFFLSFFCDTLKFPSFIKYTLDVAWVVLLLIIVFNKKRFLDRRLVPFALLFAIFFLYALIVYLFNFQSPVYFLWGVRNNFRYYIAFIGFSLFLDKDDVSGCLKFIDVMFAVNAVTVFIQFFFLDYKWDYLGGIFGNERGCNANMMFLLVIVCVKSVLSYMNGKEGLLACLSKSCASILIAAMAEIKFFFVIYAVILLLATIITRFSWKKVTAVLVLTLIVFIGGEFFAMLWGNDSALTIDRLLELITAKQYSSSRDLGRFTAIPTISKEILPDLSQKLFGLGLGNCDTSSFEICNTPFYKSHSYLNYNWLSSAFLFLETGYLGMLMYISFFVLIFIMSFLTRKTGNELYCQMAMIFSVICAAIMFYNSSLRTDIAYIAYFVLALPFISGNSIAEESRIHKSVHYE